MYNPYTNSFYHVLMYARSNKRLLLESFFYIGTSVSLQALRFQYSHCMTSTLSLSLSSYH